MLRSLFVFGLILASVPVILLKPHVGILVWSWVSYMNPHLMTYGFLTSIPLLDIVAGATILSLLISHDRIVAPATMSSSGMEVRKIPRRSPSIP